MENSGNAVEIRSFVRRTQAGALLIGGSIGILLIIFWHSNIGIGYILGTLLSVINFQLMAVDLFGMADKNPGPAKKFIILRYSLRYVLLFIALALIATRTSFNIIAVFAGLLSIQAALFGDRILMRALNGKWDRG